VNYIDAWRIGAVRRVGLSPPIMFDGAHGFSRVQPKIGKCAEKRHGDVS
jgi:hypothetical protein